MQTIQSHPSTAAQPLVSFIIPVYNVPDDMLRECLESIRQLTLRPYEREIIVVDDGSDVPLTSTLNSELDDVICIRKKNEGLSIARNTGLRMAEGKYIQFLDGDDKLLSSQYEHCLDLIRYQNADMVLFDFMREKETNRLTYNDSEPMTGSQYLRNHNIKGAAWGYIFKRRLLGELRFTPHIFHEDEEFRPLLVLRAERLIVTDAKAYFYRTRHGSITETHNTRTTLKRLNDAKEVIYSLYDKYDKIPYTERLALQRRVAQLTMDYIYNVIVMTHDRQYLDRRLEELRSKGLFPLPDQNYTKKYSWFRRMTNSSLGISILMRTLPLMTRER